MTGGPQLSIQLSPTSKVLAAKIDKLEKRLDKFQSSFDQMKFETQRNVQTLTSKLDKLTELETQLRGLHTRHFSLSSPQKWRGTKQ